MQVGSFSTNNKRYKGAFKSMEMKWYCKGIKGGGGGGEEGTPPLGRQCFTKPLGVHTYIYVLLVVKCIPKFNFVGFAMRHFDWNHHKEFFLKLSDTLLNRKFGIPK
jgi:hypothetical protein